MARCVWALCDEELTEHVWEMTEPSAKQWIFTLRDSLSHMEFTIVLVTLWMIWTARRKAIHEHIFQSPLSIHLFIKSYIEDLQLVTKPVQQPSTNQRHLSARWQAPPDGFCKIMVDGAVSRAGNQGVVGGICRDQHGHYMGAAASVFLGITDPAILETMAYREALDQAADLNISKLSISSDCKGVVRDIVENKCGMNASIIREINAQVFTFDTVRFLYESRRHNTDAHSLARATTSFSMGRHLWLVNPLDFVPISVTCMIL